MTQLTPHFSLEEMTRSETATKKGIDNTPNETERACLVRLCREVLEPVRVKYGKPIRVTSGFRCKALNKAVKGAATSQHVTGEAADLDVGADNKLLFRIVSGMLSRGELKVGQLIWEKGTMENPAWVHVSLPFSDKRPNNQILYLGIKT